MAILFFYNMSAFSFLPDYLRQEFGDRFFQFNDIDGLGDKSVASGSTGGFHVIFEGIGGLHDNRYVRVFLLISFRASIPFISGIFISSKIKSAPFSAKTFNSSRPVLACRTLQCLFKMVFNSRKLLSSSSAIRIVTLQLSSFVPISFILSVNKFQH